MTSKKPCFLGEADIDDIEEDMRIIRKFQTMKKELGR